MPSLAFALGGPWLPSDRELVERFQSGDRGAFDELVRTHYRRVYNLAYRILGNADTASDAAQAALVRAFNGLPSYRHNSAFTTWLYRIVVNVSLDHARHAKRSATVPLEAPDDEHASLAEQLPADEVDDPSASLLRRERAHAVQATLLTLPAFQRTVLVLYELQGLSFEEIGDILAVPVGTVKSRLNRARAAFAKQFSGHLELFGIGESRTDRSDEDE